MSEATLPSLLRPDLTDFRKQVSDLVAREFAPDLDRITELSKLVERIPDTDDRLGLLFEKDFILAEETASTLACKVRALLSSALKNVKTERARAILVRAPEYLSRNGIKDTAGMREAYADMDEEYLKAQEVSFALKALVEWLDIKAKMFGESYYSVRDGYRAATSGARAHGADATTTPSSRPAWTGKIDEFGEIR